MMQIFDNALLFDTAAAEWRPSAFSVEDGLVSAVGAPGSLKGGRVTDLGGARVVPGLIDAHVHIESSLLTPREFGRLSLRNGVTTVIADPHEIANVSGCAGIDFMLEDAKSSPADIFFMIPSCVPATPLDKGGAVVSAEDVASYKHTPSVIGLGEMMNVPGVLSGDPEVLAKLAVFDHIDGHAPGLSGEALCRYVSRHIKTDHECTSADEGREKLSLGMYVFLREGDAAKNIAALSSIVNDITAARCCFCTDDRHTDSLVRDGSIDHCIRVAVSCGMKLEHALRLATLSAADCFGLADRGMIAPGRIADFCILADGPEFAVLDVYKNGIPASSIEIPGSSSVCTSPPFSCRVPTKEELALPEGKLRVIGLVPGEIITEALDSETAADLCKVVSVDRYRSEGFGVGLVSGFSFVKGAIAASISHDAHNIIAAGVTDEEIIQAIRAVKDGGGGMAVVCDGKTNVLSLPCGGLMTPLAYEEVEKRMEELSDRLKMTGASHAAFMNLSFLSLTVIPHLRITPRGLFDGDIFQDVPIRFV
ncbi:Adenine deaminase [bioreactor metagenome]|uniref:adenine deaminase n=1 Tax=bioreactor metagenome TaxID=1076179 RepID=A0A644UKZ3_9ZZZZ|nr:adenine deaminase [Methanocorpusculum sp.]